jgi:ribosomal protein L11 methyltransferase
LEFRLGSLDLIMPRGGGEDPPQYDLVVNNVLTDFDVAAIEYGLPRSLAPGGVLILSGIRAEETARMEAAVTAAGLEVMDLLQDNKWAAIGARRKNGDEP